MWRVVYLREAEEERAKLPKEERNSLDNAVEKLEQLGSRLPFPHSSNVQGQDDLRELRPRSGQSPWRALYRQVGDPFVIAAIGPEAKKDNRGFNRACQQAAERLAKLEDDDEDPEAD
jgi:hypothetical protein